MNILCFCTDQQRADHLGCMGNPDVRTPHIDSLAAAGATFTECYVANPVCMPNRASLFTGRYPSAHRLRENGIPLSTEELTLPRVLANSGYATASFGKIHMQPFNIADGVDLPTHQSLESRRYWRDHDELPVPYYGFEHVYLVSGHGDYTAGHYKRDLDRQHPGAWDQMLCENARDPLTGAFECWKSTIPEQLHYNAAIADQTIAWLRQRPKDKPFFAWCSFPDPHHPFSPPAPWCDRHDPSAIAYHPPRRAGEKADLPRSAREHGGAVETPDEHYREMVAGNYGMIEMVDHHIGRVLAELTAQGLMDDTIVLFTSDHGDMMGDHGFRLKGPFPYRGLLRVPLIVRVPGNQAGRSTAALCSTVDIFPTLLDLAGVIVPDGVQGKSQRTVLDGQADAVRDRVYMEYDQSHVPERLRYVRSREWAMALCANSNEVVLFDLRADPQELHNLWSAPGAAAARREMLALLAQESVAADDWLPPKRCWA